MMHAFIIYSFKVQTLSDGVKCVQKLEEETHENTLTYFIMGFPYWKLVDVIFKPLIFTK